MLENIRVLIRTTLLFSCMIEHLQIKQNIIYYISAVQVHNFRTIDYAHCSNFLSYVFITVLMLMLNELNKEMSCVKIRVAGASFRILQE